MNFARAASTFLGTFLVVAILQAASVHCGYDSCGFYNTHYKNVHTGAVTEGKAHAGLICPGGGSITQSNEGLKPVVTVIVDGGVTLDYEKIWKEGVPKDASYTAHKSSSGTVTLTCPPGGWVCSMMVIPDIRVIWGLVRKDYVLPLVPCSQEWHPFEITAPNVDGSNVATLRYGICTCKNRAHWADPGHPELLCDWNC